MLGGGGDDGRDPLTPRLSLPLRSSTGFENAQATPISPTALERTLLQRLSHTHPPHHARAYAPITPLKPHPSPPLTYEPFHGR